MTPHSLLPLGLALALVFLATLWVLRPLSRRKPAAAPVPGRSDVLMAAALDRAAARLPEFQKLRAAAHDHAQVLLEFETASGARALSWAKVVPTNPLDEDLRVQLVYPLDTDEKARLAQDGPSGAYDVKWGQQFSCHLGDVKDWFVVTPDDKVHGGETLRAALAIARRDGRPLASWQLAREAAFV